MTTSLATIEAVNTIAALELFKPGALDPILGRIEQEAREQAASLEISTEANRAALASLAYKIARSKTYIDDQGKDLGEGLRTQLTAINDERKRARERLDTLKDEVRKPLTEWENLEKERVAAHEAALAEIEGAGDYTARTWQSLTAEAISDRIREIETDTRNWEEFSQRAAGVRAVALTAMKRALAAAEKLDAEKAEADRLRKEAAERAIKEREEAAARAATQAAEDKARRQAEAVERAAEAERQRIEKEKADAEARARYEEQKRIAAEQEAQRQLDEAEKRRVAESQAALRRAEIAEYEAKQAQEWAVEAERERIAAAIRAEEEAAAKREANKRHRAKINREAKTALIDHAQLSAELAEAVVSAIAKGLIPHITIEY